MSIWQIDDDEGGHEVNTAKDDLTDAELEAWYSMGDLDAGERIRDKMTPYAKAEFDLSKQAKASSRYVWEPGDVTITPPPSRFVWQPGDLQPVEPRPDFACGGLNERPTPPKPKSRIAKALEKLGIGE